MSSKHARQKWVAPAQHLARAATAGMRISLYAAPESAIGMQQRGVTHVSTQVAPAGRARVYAADICHPTTRNPQLACCACASAMACLASASSFAYRMRSMVFTTCSPSHASFDPSLFTFGRLKLMIERVKLRQGFSSCIFMSCKLGELQCVLSAGFHSLQGNAVSLRPHASMVVTVHLPG